MSDYLKAVLVFIFLGLLVVFCIATSGCATTGAIAPQLVEQSAAVDTSISQLQEQQTVSSQAAQAVSDTAESIKQTAEKINNPELTAQINRLSEQTKTLLDGQKAERDKTAQIQTTYTAVKTTAGTALADNARQINKLQSQIAIYKKWILRLGISLSVLILLIVLYIVFKLKGKISFL